MKVTRSNIEQMMQEEMETIQAEAPRTEITRTDIRQMMEEEAHKLKEARKRPLKRDREKFSNNQDMVSGLQKTITNYLKEAGVKIKPRHTKAVEKMSTRLMHVANSPMIRLEEDIHYEGLHDIVSDFLFQEISSWHDEAKADLLETVKSEGFDLTQQLIALLTGNV